MSDEERGKCGRPPDTVPGTGTGYPVPVVRLKSTLHLKSTLLLKITLILKYSRISLIYCQMQLIWVLVSTNDVLNNWIIMVLKKCKRIPIKKESIIGLEGRLKILWVEKYSKTVLLCWSTGLTQRLEVSGFWNIYYQYIIILFKWWERLRGAGLVFFL